MMRIVRVFLLERIRIIFLLVIIFIILFLLGVKGRIFSWCHTANPGKLLSFNRITHRRSINFINQGPVKDIIIIKSFFVHQINKYLPQVRIVGFIFKSQASAIMKVIWYFRGKTLANLFNWATQLSFHDLLNFFCL